MPDGSNEPTGSELRQKLEDTIAERNNLRQEVVALRASTLIQEKQLTLVRPEDLDGVKPEDVESKALGLQQERLAAREQTVRSIFADQGLEGDDLEAAVANLLAGSTQDESGVSTDNPDNGDGYDRMRQLNQIEGQPPGQMSTSNLRGRDAIAAGLAKG